MENKFNKKELNENEKAIFDMLENNDKKLKNIYSIRIPKADKMSRYRMTNIVRFTNLEYFIKLYVTYIGYIDACILQDSSNEKNLIEKRNDIIHFLRTKTELFKQLNNCEELLSQIPIPPYKYEGFLKDNTEFEITKPLAELVKKCYETGYCQYKFVNENNMNNIFDKYTDGLKEMIEQYKAIEMVKSLS